MSKQTKKPWQGRFTESTNEFVEEFTASIKFDQTLAIYDIRCSLAHAEMLASEGIILKKERLLEALRKWKLVGKNLESNLHSLV